MSERRLTTILSVLAGAMLALALPTAVAAQEHTSPIQVTSDGLFVWVANPDSDSLGKIDASAESLLAEYAVGDNPRTIALDDVNGWVYVANQGSEDLTPKPNPETVMRLDMATGAVQQTHALPLGCAPYGVIVRESGGGNHIYVSCERTQQVVVLDADLSPTPIATIALDWPDPRGMAVSADNSRVYVAHFLTREPSSTAHVSEIDATQSPPVVVRVLDIPVDVGTCETINSGPGVLNMLLGIHLTPPGAPAAVANQLWVGGVNQSNFEKGLFLRDERFGGHAKPLLCVGGSNDGKPCEDDSECPGGGACTASFEATSRDVYKASFHDITRFQIAKIDLDTGQVVGKIDVDEANMGTDIAFSSDGTTAYVVDQTFNSMHIFNTARGQDGNATTLFASVSRFGPGGDDPSQPCTGGAFLTSSESPHRLDPQVEITPIRGNALFVAGNPANTGHDYNVTTGKMEALPDGIGTTPHGVAVHPLGAKIYVANFLSRNVISVKVDQFFCSDASACQTNSDCLGRCAPRMNAVIPSIVGPDPIPAPLLDGKFLFHTAARDASVPNGIGLGSAAPLFNFDDPAVLEPVGFVTSTSHDASYVACISCHPEGGLDGRSWDFSQFGASIRNTMDLRGRASFEPGQCSDDPNVTCVVDAQCGNFGIGSCSNEPSAVCELDIQCGQCDPESPSAGEFCIADRECGGKCSQDDGIACSIDGDCGGVCNEDPNKPCASNAECDFGCQIVNTCLNFPCATTSCNAAKCRPPSVASIPRNVTNTDPFFNPMLTVHWNGDRDEVEDFEFTFRSLLGAGDCDGVEHLPDKCIGALVMRSNVAKPQEANPDLGEGNRGLSPRLDHMADYVYSLTSFVRNPNLDGGPSAEAQAGRDVFNSAVSRCAECHNGPSPSNQHFTDKVPLASHPLGQQGGPDVFNPFLRHNVGTFNDFDLTDPFEVASAKGTFQNSALPLPGSRGPLIDYITPAIVDVWNSAPYNHDGSFATLLHGIMPCNDALDDCSPPYAGKNINDQHGTTSTLTPQQLRLLVAFLKAPHGPIAPGSSSVSLATPFTRLDKVKVQFKDPPGNDKFSVKASLTLPGSLNLVDLVLPNGKTVKVLDEPVTFTLADVDEELIERTIPAGHLIANSKQTRFSFKDKTGTIAPGIRQLRLKQSKSNPNDYTLQVKGQGMDLSTLDKNHITVALEIGDDAFVKTRTFSANSKRSKIQVKEK